MNFRRNLYQIEQCRVSTTMGFISTLIRRIPIFFIAIGLIMITGSYRGEEVGSRSLPLLVGGTVVFGVVLLIGLSMSDIGS